MKISQIRFAKLAVPLITPFKTAMRTVNNIEDVVVLVETACGQIGYGAAPATPVITGDTHGSIIYAIEHLIKPQIVGMEIENINQILQRIHGSMINNNSAKAAVEIAIYDLWGKWLDKPLYQALGGGATQLKTDVTISVDGIDKMLQDSQRAIQQGFDILKIKIGKDIHMDIERVKAIYQAVGKQVQLRLDVNQGWTAKQTVFALEQLDQSGVQLELIEQPVPANDIAGMRYVTQHVSTPVMADESAFSPKQVIELIQTGAADIINIKLMKTAGLSHAIKIADIASVYNVECMIGCMLEGSIGVAAAAHLASAKASIINKIDLDGPALGQFDPVQGGVDFNGATITLSDGPGLGIDSIEQLQPLVNGVWV
ncbi:dipeptide epimerase [uncultured Paraglaciecola sp.]|uniref:mandelate racemase/muconate lactonizing enzyme family protein n=1 Tax=uncultured Paraglaciecola sp. TaxID=1765024 RepID=UPI0030DAE895|tara:strand:+ start:4206 stop:5315 length:1110 start_codon:yes stop_codon:yes gene_type:complete